MRPRMSGHPQVPSAEHLCSRGSAFSGRVALTCSTTSSVIRSVSREKGLSTTWKESRHTSIPDTATTQAVR